MRHSLWEQGSLEGYNEVLLGCLDSEVGALRQRRAEYEGSRRLSEGSDSCWSDSGNDSGSEAVLEAGIEPLALEGGVVVVTQGGEVEGAAVRAVEPSAAADGEAQASLHRCWHLLCTRCGRHLGGIDGEGL